MSLFRPCIDLHDGKVKQIVGGTLSDSGSGLKTNFEVPGCGCVEGDSNFGGIPEWGD